MRLLALLALSTLAGSCCTPANRSPASPAEQAARPQAGDPPRTVPPPGPLEIVPPADAGSAPRAAPSEPAAGAAPAAELGPCTSDDDCTLTRQAPGSCCPMLCTDRPITKKRAAELAADSKCAGQKLECPIPLCRAGRASVPVCLAGRCGSRDLDTD